MSSGAFTTSTILLLIIIGLPLVIIWVGLRAWRRRESSTLRITGGTLMSLGVAMLCIVGWWLLRVGPGQSGIVSSGTSPDGREYCVVQTYSDLIEPYQVSLYVRDEAGIWRWHFLEHEGDAWPSARVEFRGDRALVFRDGERFAKLELARGKVEPEVIDLDGYLALKALPSELSAKEVAELHHRKFRR